MSEDWVVHPTERELTAYGDGYEDGIKDGMKEAQVEMKTLKAENAQLREALKPFAALAQYYGDTRFPDSAVALVDGQYDGMWTITFGQLRAVFALMENEKPE